MAAAVALTALLAAIAVLTGVLVLRERSFAQERREWTLERSSLLNRIKPETAQLPGVPQDFQLVEPVRTDEDYWAAREENPYAYEEPGSKPFAPYPQDERQDTSVMRMMTPPGEA
jgi:hypothetical protein